MEERKDKTLKNTKTKPKAETNSNTCVTSATTSTDSVEDDVDEVANSLRKTKVWNEPVYTKKKTIPSVLKIQPSEDKELPPEEENGKVPLTVKVEKGSKFFGDPRRMYPMYSCPRGNVLIINNQAFDYPDIYSFREGAEVDAENLDNLFTQLGFNVTKYKNLRRNETLKKLIEFSDFVGKVAGDMTIVCVLSHGTERGKVVSSDCLEIDTELDILRRFNNDYCPELKGKPKFFIIQACRGEEQDFGTSLSPKNVTDAKKSAPGGRGRSPSFLAKDLSWEDMLIAYATLPGYVANRNHYRGTWFVESLCKVFMENAKDMSLRDMLDEVGLELKGYESEMGTKQSFSYDVRHFYKKLYFNPGITIEWRDQWKHTNSVDFDQIQAQDMKDMKEEETGLGVNKKRTISHSGHLSELI